MASENLGENPYVISPRNRPLVSTYSDHVEVKFSPQKSEDPLMTTYAVTATVKAPQK